MHVIRDLPLCLEPPFPPPGVIRPREAEARHALGLGQTPEPVCRRAIRRAVHHHTRGLSHRRLDRQLPVVVGELIDEVQPRPPPSPDVVAPLPLQFRPVRHANQRGRRPGLLRDLRTHPPRQPVQNRPDLPKCTVRAARVHVHQFPARVPDARAGQVQQAPHPESGIQPRRAHIARLDHGRRASPTQPEGQPPQIFSLLRPRLKRHPGWRDSRVIRPHPPGAPPGRIDSTPSLILLTPSPVGLTRQRILQPLTDSAHTRSRQRSSNSASVNSSRLDTGTRPCSRPSLGIRCHASAVAVYAVTA